MKRVVCVGFRVAAVVCLAASLGCPGIVQRGNFELWIANQTSFAINQIVLTNHVTGQADNVISAAIPAQTLARLELSVSKYGVDTNDVGIIGDGGILLVFPASNLGNQAVNVIVVARPTPDTFAATGLAVDDRTEAAAAKALLEAAGGQANGQVASTPTGR
ncbi:MAG: hypothetical protein HZB26_08960 [Candidatus Hydrogenedentes bacterium]|nr:hypothetical protein [Candidatus Hydrogenedentota bacterium]